MFIAIVRSVRFYIVRLCMEDDVCARIAETRDAGFRAGRIRETFLVFLFLMGVTGVQGLEFMCASHHVAYVCVAGE
jgi:hypothetical protein